MGAWGTGLYSGDFASDLRIAVAAVARLPFDGERLLGLLCDTEPSAALDPKDPDHTAFWLVCADQFAKRGIVCSSVLEAALAIIDQDRDLATMSSLGMNETGLRARRRMLADLRQRLVASTPSSKPRTVLKEPQPYLLETGDVIVFPTTRGHCINPYFQSKEAITGGWRQDGWGAALIVERGRAFDFLTWYRPLRAPEATVAKPDLAELVVRADWTLQRPGTLSRSHFKRMEIEVLGSLSIDAAKLNQLFPKRPAGITDAIADISIANRLSLPAGGGGPVVNHQPTRALQTLRRLADIQV
jgi:hypothetical protein